MIATIMMSIRHPVGSVFLFVYAKHGRILWGIARFLLKLRASCGNCALLVDICALLVEKVRVSCNSSCGNIPSVSVFWGALRGVGGRLSQFCGTRPNSVGSSNRRGCRTAAVIRASATCAQAVLSSGTVQDVDLRHGWWHFWRFPCCRSRMASSR